MAKIPKFSADERKWRAQDARRTLTEADRIRGDRTLMSDVKKYAQEQVKSLAKVAGAASTTTRKARTK